MASFLFRLVTLLLLGLGAPVQAQIGTSHHIRPELVVESASPRAGSTVTLAIVMRTEPGWHGYWRNPGDAGVAPRVRWALPAEVRAGPLAYPVPQPLLIAGLMNYVFERDHALLAELRIAPDAKAGMPLPIAVQIDYLVCSASLCVPERAALSTRLTVGDGAIAADRRPEFDRWRAALPQPLGAAAVFAQAGGEVRLQLPLPRGAPLSQPYFFPLTESVIDYAAPQSVTRDGDRLVVTIKGAAGAARLPGLEGVLRIGSDRALSIAASPGTVAGGGVPVGQGAGAAAPGLLLAIGGALLGGLLLNLMPCVFPILSLKALSLARLGENRATARREALAYAAGAVLACLALGGVILALRAGGEAAGWAFQLQSPRVTLALLVLVSAIALNLAGLFELPTLGGSVATGGGVAGSFLTGALAAFIATPCTGPFMAAALGAALALPTIAALGVFGGLGLGLALPFVAIAFVPGLQRLMPRPGAWMATLRRLLALPMLATALGLVWLLGRQAGVTGMTLGLAAALVAGSALWWVGLRQARGAGYAWAPALLLLAAAPALGMIGSSPPATQATGDEPFSAARLAAIRAAGRPAFVYFTADWCLTCKVNEAAAIDRSDVRTAFMRHNVAVLAGDWTRGDPAITRFLAEHGRSGVPLYLFYPAGGEARELPQLLTPGGLVALAG